MSDKILPSAVEAEERILCALMLDSSFLPDILNRINPHDFYSSKHQAIYEAIQDLYNTGIPVDLVTLTEQLKATGKLKTAGGASALSDMVEYIPAAPNVEQYARIIADKAVLRRLIQQSSTIMQKCYDCENATDALGYANDAISSLRDAHNSSDLAIKQRAEDLAAELEDWISLAPGEFNLLDVMKQFPKNVSPKDLTIALELLEKSSIIERAGRRRCNYRPYNADIEKIDYHNASDDPLDVWLPFGLGRFVEIMPGNIVMISGSPNSGKTAIMLNIAIDNQRDFGVHYFSSEMGAGEMRKRLSKHKDLGLNDMTFAAYQRDSDFADVIRPGEGNLNIIDFLEIHDNFYLAGQMIKDIHAKLNGAIVFIAMQKNPGNDTGLGGYRMMEKTRLALTVEAGVMKITKAKNYRDPSKNPNGMAIDFKIINGINLAPDRQKNGWYYTQ